MAICYHTTFEVIGKHSFPLDMLRYDQAYPARSEDAVEISDCNTNDKPRSEKLALRSGGVFRIRLNRISVSNRPPEAGRWSSFGWSVDGSTVKTTRL